MITAKQRILLILLKDFTSTHTATHLGEVLGMSRQGVWKVVKMLQFEELITSRDTGKGKTSTQTVHLSWNSLTEKTLALALAQEASQHKRWLFNFKDMEDKVDFLVLFGSILHSPMKAGDIDFLTVADKKKLTEVNEIIFKIQKSQEKKIHANNFTNEEFREELQKHNKVFVDALTKGIVLFGQDNFVKFMRDLK